MINIFVLQDLVNDIKKMEEPKIEEPKEAKIEGETEE